ncbi:MAG: transglycosylase SLT domain-containing protein [bacterium]|nr:transglycosylase SLT domain-containing protein [bacterium]
MINLIFVLLLSTPQRYIELHEFGRAIPMITDSQQLGSLYLRLHNYEKALSVVKEPFQIAYIYENKGELDSAIKYYKKADSLLMPHSLFKIAHCLLEMRRYSDALNYLNSIVIDYPNFVYIQSVYKGLADCYSALGNYSTAISVIEKGFVPPLSWYYVAVLKERSKQSAKDLWLRLATEYPESEYAKYCLDRIPEDSLRLRGRINFFAKDYEKAITCLGDVKGEEELVAKSLFNKKLYDRAEILATDKGFWKIAGDCERKLGNLELALRYYQQSSDSEAIFWNAYCLHQLGRKQEAMLKYKDVPQWSDNSEVADLRTIMLAMELKRFDVGFEACKNISAPTSYYWTYRLYDLQGKKDSAKTYLTKVIKEYPFSYYTWLLNERNLSPFRGNISVSLLECEPLQWINQWAKTPYTVKGNEQVSFRRGELLLKLGITKEGIDEVRSINNEHPLFYWKIAKLFYHYGINDLAIVYAKKITFPGAIPRKFAEVLYPVCFLPTIDELSQELDEFLLLAIMREESQFNPAAMSSANAMGLTQVIPKTAKHIARELGVSHYNMFDPPTSIRFGAHYINKMKELLYNKEEFALAAYNGGPDNVRDWIASTDTSKIDCWVEQIPFDQTRRYVKRVIGNYCAYEQIYGE